MKYKIVFFDMDGTLYQTKDNVIQQSSLDAIQKLRKQGIIVCAATGRPLNQMNLILEHLTFDHMILINGGYVLDGKGNLLFENPISDSTTQDIVSWSKENDYPLMMHFGDKTHIYNEFYTLYNFCVEHHVLERLFYDKNQIYHKNHHAYNAVVRVHRKEDLDAFLRTHPELRSDAINDYFYDVFQSTNDKFVGIQQLLNKLHISWDEVVAFGDSTNDIKMLEMAGMGVAMGNASSYVQSYANMVTTSVYNDGIANGLKKIFEF